MDYKLRVLIYIYVSKSFGEDGVVIFSLGSTVQNVLEEKNNMIASGSCPDFKGLINDLLLNKYWSDSL